MLRSLVSAALPLAALAVGCQGEPLQPLLPKIAIGDPVDPSFSLCAAAKIRDCNYDFQEVTAGSFAVLTFDIENTASAELDLKTISVVGSPHFTIDGDVPRVIDGGGNVVVTVRYGPDVAVAETAQIVIVSNADNLNAGENVVINLKARGHDPGAPAIAVNPAECDFGAVGLGARALCTLSIANTGTVELDVGDASFTADTPPVFGFVDALTLPLAVQAGTAVSATFYAEPASLDPASGTLVITSNDATTPTIQVPFTVRGAQAPTAVARVASINGTANTASDPAVEPLDDVVLSGDQSTGYGGAQIVSYAWTIVEKPPESSLVLSAPSAVETGFTFSSAAGDVSGVDVAGTFRINLVVTDDTGASSSNDATVTFNAVPTEGLHVQLTWSASSNDLDLHLGRNQPVSWCTHDDCYYGNCESSPLNWDGVSTHAGDPTLDIDDVDGFGPENIDVDAPVDGNYVVAVHAYDGTGGGAGFTPTDVTVKIFVHGALAQQFTGHFDTRNQFWRVARLDVSAGSVAITPMDTLGTAPDACKS